MESLKVAVVWLLFGLLFISGSDALLCFMCGTQEYPECQPNPGPVIGCPAGTRCWTLYDDILKERVKARGCSYASEKTNGCARGPGESWRCFCAEKHLCNK
ncbi:unnamed protein product [Notodromas monacha]|uniref:Uncharacterized protein n=1 Tax=Notodromas monacha TaxID=399045 RepID=A0A7R9G8K6_9CRUS|nr:unnamed protein product [Notodromas monacha]CAG0913290.1 unnamed protein product [Notodromas monacha]